jgi:hypothetical protein
MMVISYIWGQKSYPVPYAWKKLLAYIVIVVILYFIHQGIIALRYGSVFNFAVASFLLAFFALFIYRVEKKEFENFFKMRKELK